MSQSSDDVPLGQRARAPVAMDEDSDEDMPLQQRVKGTPNQAPATTTDRSDAGQSASSSSESDSDSDSDNQTLAARRKALTPTPKKKATPAATKKRKAPANGTSSKQPKRQRSTSSQPRRAAKKGEKAEQKWTTLVHHGVQFPPEYEPHGVKMLCDGKPVNLTPEQEEVASMYAVMLQTDYIKKPIFNANFWAGFKEVLGKDHVIKSLEKCDFTPMYEHFMAEREAKKALSKEEKLALKEAKEAQDAKYKTALIDGRAEAVGNFKVEPPGLFRGRGEHPRMGKIKQRVYPRDITINIGKDAPTPEHPYPGQEWKEVRHDNTVTWLAYWKDTVDPKAYKYVWLGATSTFKADSDLAKYEKARKLKDYIDEIRTNYTRDWDSKDLQRKQMAVALYFLDKLALRAGHEKDEDEADTVGCCTLKVENIELVDPKHIKFDFLGKDSIRYENTVEVEPKVYKNVEQFMRMDKHGKKKEPRSMLFDTFDATDLNKELKSLMDGLSVKVFRTYNASITLDRLLREEDARCQEEGSVRSEAELKAAYDRANKEVAILCNHQRAVPKAHDTQLAKMRENIERLEGELKELQADLRAAKKGEPNSKGRKEEPGRVAERIAKKQEMITRAKVQMESKEDLKTVALGTSKINYMDPRITIAWCKRNEMPIERIFNKSLLSKFYWAMDADWEFKF